MREYALPQPKTPASPPRVHVSPTRAAAVDAANASAANASAANASAANASGANASAPNATSAASVFAPDANVTARVAAARVAARASARAAEQEAEALALGQALALGDVLAFGMADEICVRVWFEDLISLGRRVYANMSVAADDVLEQTGGAAVYTAGYPSGYARSASVRCWRFGDAPILFER